MQDALTKYGYELCNNCLYFTEEKTEDEEVTEDENENNNAEEFNNEYDDNFNDDYEEEEDEYDYNCRPSWGGVSWGQPGDGYPIYDG